jgi:hypothetical protein
MLEELGVPALDSATLHEADLLAFRCFSSDPDRFIRLSGLVWHGAALSRVIEGAALRSLLKIVPAEDLRFALSAGADITTDLREMPPHDRIKAALDAAGRRVVSDWAEVLPDAYGPRVLLHLPRSTAARHNVDDGSVTTAVRRVAEAMSLTGHGPAAALREAAE